jgi:hypothetical protein
MHQSSAFGTGGGAVTTSIEMRYQLAADAGGCLGTDSAGPVANAFLRKL